MSCVSVWYHHSGQTCGWFFLKLGMTIGFDLNLKHGLKIWKMVTIVTRKAKNCIFARKTIGATDLKLGMYIQLHSGSNIGWVPPGHTSFSCVRLLMPKMIFQQKHLKLRS